MLYIVGLEYVYLSEASESILIVRGDDTEKYDFFLKKYDSCLSIKNGFRFYDSLIGEIKWENENVEENVAEMAKFTS